jgi:HEAT repeat protein
MNEHSPPQNPLEPQAGRGDQIASLPDLPPVEAPSASFVIQLFVIPAVVVGVVIVVWLLFGKLAGGERDAMEYVQQLRRPSANWRSAFELASLIRNDVRLAQDPRLLGELTDLLDSELKENENPQLTQYVALCLGAFQTLEAKLADGRSVDPLDVLARALEPRYGSQIQIAAVASLAKQASRLDGQLDHPRAIAALEQAASGGDAELRQIAAYALGFFGGDDSARVLRERLTSDEDRYVRYNAAIALGRRGDMAALGTLREMLSTANLEQVVQIASATEKQHKIESIQLEALQALQAAQTRGDHELARSLRSEIELLSRSGLVSIRNQAKAVLQKIQSNS